MSVERYRFRSSVCQVRARMAPDVRPRVHDRYARIGERPAFRTAVEWPDETGQGYEKVGLTTKR